MDRLVHGPVTTTMASGYLLSNTELQTVDRFGGLEATFDPATIAHLERLGIGTGARCLEVGAGGGSIAHWLAERVGPTGRVLATDLDPRWHRPAVEPLEVRRHDLVHEPVPAGPWDLVHERLVLVHVPERLEVLDRLVAELAPGGWIVVEDFDTSEVRTTDPDGPRHELVVRVGRAFNRLLGTRGAANPFAAGALRHLRDRGLVETGASGHVVIAEGRSAYAQVLAANARQVRDGLLAQGITPTDLDDYLAALDDPTVIIGSPVMVTAWGRRPT